MSLIAPMVPAITPERMRLMFPTLTGSQIERIGKHGTARAVREGDVVFAAGDRVVPFFVVRTGTRGHRSSVRGRGHADRHPRRR